MSEITPERLDEIEARVSRERPTFWGRDIADLCAALREVRRERDEERAMRVGTERRESAIRDALGIDPAGDPAPVQAARIVDELHESWAREAALREALIRNADHLCGCPAVAPRYPQRGLKCVCGLDDALDAVDAAPLEAIHALMRQISAVPWATWHEEDCHADGEIYADGMPGECCDCDVPDFDRLRRFFGEPRP